VIMGLFILFFLKAIYAVRHWTLSGHAFLTRDTNPRFLILVCCLLCTARAHLPAETTWRISPSRPSTLVTGLSHFATSMGTCCLELHLQPDSRPITLSEVLYQAILSTLMHDDASPAAVASGCTGLGCMTPQLCYAYNISNSGFIEICLTYFCVSDEVCVYMSRRRRHRPFV
jgi:hypothetical protein